MSFLDGKDCDQVRLGHVKPMNGEKCIICGRPPATSGVEYCGPCGHHYAVSIGAKERKVEVVEKVVKKSSPKMVTAKPKRKPRKFLTAEEKLAIREHVAAGGRQIDMARKYGVSQPTVSILCKAR